MNETNMSEVVRLASEVSGQSDRWFFTAAAIVLMGFAWAVIRYLVRELSASRTAYHDTLRRIIDEQNKLAIDFKVSLDRNTEALRINNQLLERANHREK